MAGRILLAVVVVWLAAAGVWAREPAYLILAGVFAVAWLSVELDERSGRRISRRRR